MTSARNLSAIIAVLTPPVKWYKRSGMESDTQKDADLGEGFTTCP
jgi:hypothetical protein